VETDLTPFAELALACVQREYPNKIAHVLRDDGDALPPRQLTPAFWGCFDWHSAVHGHWLLARYARLHPDGRATASAREALARSLTSENIRGEVRYFEGEGRAGSERPYGLAWLLTLAQELREWDDADARAWSAALAPLERLAARRMRVWLPKLTHPVRSGEHGQTAFAMGLCLDWARVTGDELGALIVARARDFPLGDEDAPLRSEPSAHDFLSPCLAEADLMRRVLARGDFARWLTRFLPIPDEAHEWLPPVECPDPLDGKLAHLDGLNLSRAWMLEGIASALDADDARMPALAAAAQRHRDAGLSAVLERPYEGSHWLGTFAMYLVSARGLG
jgi:hypothetical protein